MMGGVRGLVLCIVICIVSIENGLLMRSILCSSFAVDDCCKTMNRWRAVGLSVGQLQFCVAHKQR